MLYWKVLRHSLLLPSAVLLIALSYLAASAQASAWQSDWATASAHLLSTVVVIGPLTAGIAAWEAGRFRRSGFGFLMLSMPRSSQSYARFVIIGTFVAALLGFASAAVVVKERVIGGGTVWWPIILLGVLALLVCAILGFALGSYASSIVAAPLSIFATYVWMVFGSVSLGGPWVRLSPITQDCCSINSELSSVVTTSEFCWLIALLVFGLLLIRAKARLELTSELNAGRTASHFLPASVSILAGLVIVGIYGGPMTVTAATIPQPSCDRSKEAVTVCTWPQHEYQLQRTMDAVKYLQLKLPGVKLPTLFLESGLPGPRKGSFATFDLPGPPVVPRLLAEQISQNLISQIPNCSSSSKSSSVITAEEYFLASAWMTESFSDDRIPPAKLVPPLMQGRLTALVQLPWNMQAIWFQHDNQALRACNSLSIPIR